MGKQFPIWVLGSVVVFAAAGAAVGPVIAGSIAGNSGVTVEQAVLIDRENFSLQDFGPMVDDAVVAINDDGTSFTMGLELQVGEEIVVDLPLANQSDATASILATLVTSPGLRKEISVFWDSISRSDSPSVSTTTPSPAPQTSVTPQSSDTTATTTAPTGAAALSAQYAIGTATNSSPGLPDSTPQPDSASETTISPTSSVTITANTSDLTATATVSSLSSLVSDRTPNFSYTNAEPDADLPTIASQSVTSTSTTTQPTGAANSLSGTWYTGQWQVDTNSDGSLETVYFVPSDPDATSSYNTMDISTDDATFGETRGGTLSGQSPKQTQEDDDERITASSTDVRLGSFYLFTVDFDTTPDGTEDGTITAKTWFTATVTTTDLDGDGSADDTFYAVLTDDDSDGLYEEMDLSIGDNDFGEGSLSNEEVDYDLLNNADDERVSGSGYVLMGVNPFNFSIDTSPAQSITPS